MTILSLHFARIDPIRVSSIFLILMVLLVTCDWKKVISLPSSTHHCFYYIFLFDFDIWGVKINDIMSVNFQCSFESRSCCNRILVDVENGELESANILNF